MKWIRKLFLKDVDEEMIRLRLRCAHLQAQERTLVERFEQAVDRIDHLEFSLAQQSEQKMHDEASKSQAEIAYFEPSSNPNIHVISHPKIEGFHVERETGGRRNATLFLDDRACPGVKKIDVVHTKKGILANVQIELEHETIKRAAVPKLAKTLDFVVKDRPTAVPEPIDDEQWEEEFSSERQLAAMK